MKNIRLLILLFLIHLFFLVNLRFTAWPEMISFPYLVNNGFSLYQDLVHPYPPLLTIILSRVFLTFGYSVTALKILTWSFILINDTFIWLIAQRVSKSRSTAFLSVLFYVLVQPFLEGNMMWVDLGFVPFVLGGLYYYLRSLGQENGKPNYNIIISGLLFALAAFVKQTAVLFALPVVILLLVQKKTKLLKLFLTAPLFIGSLFVLKLYAIGDLSHFLNWTVIFPSLYWTSFPGYVDMILTKREFAIIGLLFLPLIAFLMIKYKDQKNYLFLWLMLPISLTVVYPRFSFFHLQSALAVAAILLGTTFALRKQYAVLVGILVLLYPLVQRPVVASEWRKSDRFNTSAEKELSMKISNEVSHDETVYLLNVHSGYYVYADRLPPKPWVDNYGWYYEIVDVQESVLSAWRDTPPDYILWKEPEVGEWYELGTYEPKLITEWINDNYVRQVELQQRVWLWRHASL